MQTQDRTKTVGASDVAAILGVPGAFGSPISVFLEKTGATPQKEQSEAMEWGLRLEEQIGRKYADEKGVQIFKPDPPSILHPDFDWVSCSPDFLVVEQPGGLECKNVGTWMKKHWDAEDNEGIPPYYLPQIIWCSMVMGATMDIEWWDAAALFGGSQYRTWRIHRDKEMEERIFSLVADFWFNNVQAGIAPAVDGSAAVADYLSAKYPRNVEPLRLATEYEQSAIVSYNVAAREMKAWEEKKKLAKAQLQAAIADAEGLEGPGMKATWKTQAGRSFFDTAGLLEDTHPGDEESQKALKATYTKKGSDIRVLRVTVKEQ